MSTRGDLYRQAFAEQNALERKLKLAVDALTSQPCNCRCSTHGYGCGVQDATCHKDTTFKCTRCAALEQIGKEK